MKDKEKRVVVYQTANYSYPKIETALHSSGCYPEFSTELEKLEVDSVYDSVRNCLHLLGLDASNFGRQEWNPLSDWGIRPGCSVLIKPNLVMHHNPVEGQGTECLFTQPSVVVPVIDYVALALQGRGKIVIGDAPMQECDFEQLISESGYVAMIRHYKEKFEKEFNGELQIELADFRQLRSKPVGLLRKAVIDQSKQGVVVDLGQKSSFCSADSKSLQRFRITNYDPRILITHHTETKHEYMISRYALEADFIINMPKPKTHRKAGVTISLKNLVGINARKEYLPHHTLGAIGDGGDEYEKSSKLHALRSAIIDKRNAHMFEKKYYIARTENLLIRILTKTIRILQGKNFYEEGSWYGNHTISRTINDLNEILLYANKKGIICDHKRRKILTIADMIISGEKEGPVLPSKKPVGIIAAGFNSVLFDETVSTLMGFDFRKIPTIVLALKNKRLLDGTDITPEIISNNQSWNGKSLFQIDKKETLHYCPTAGWAGHIEL